MEDYSRFNGPLATPNLPGRIWEIHKKRKIFDRRHRKGKWSAGEAEGKETRENNDDQAVMNEVKFIEQEADDETHAESIPNQKGPPRKIDLII